MTMKSEDLLYLENKLEEAASRAYSAMLTIARSERRDRSFSSAQAAMYAGFEAYRAALVRYLRLLLESGEPVKSRSKLVLMALQEELGDQTAEQIVEEALRAKAIADARRRLKPK